VSFFKIAIYLAISMIVFNLVIGFVGSLQVFPVEVIPGTGVVDESDALNVFTDLGGDMSNLWLIVTTVFAIPAIGLAILTKSWIPVGLYGFSVGIFCLHWFRSQWEGPYRQWLNVLYEDA